MIRALLALVLLLPFAPQTSEAFVFRKIVYCSPIEGLVHWAGKPLENVVATRELYSGGFDGGKYSDTATTNAQGQFKFAVVEERRFLRPDLLSANPTISQLVWLSHEGHRHQRSGGVVISANASLPCKCQKWVRCSNDHNRCAFKNRRNGIQLSAQLPFRFKRTSPACPAFSTAAQAAKTVTRSLGKNQHRACTHHQKI